MWGPTVREEDWGWSPKAIISASLTRLCPNAKGEHTSAFGTQSYESIHWFFKFSEQFSSQTTMWGRTVREEDWGWSPKAIISASLTRLCLDRKGEHTSPFGTQSYESNQWFLKFSEQFFCQTATWGLTVREEDWGWSPKTIISASLTRLCLDGKGEHTSAFGTQSDSPPIVWVNSLIFEIFRTVFLSKLQCEDRLWGRRIEGEAPRQS